MIGDYFIGTLFYQETITLVGSIVFISLAIVFHVLGCISGCCSHRKSKDLKADEEDDSIFFPDEKVNAPLVNRVSTTAPPSHQRALLHHDYSNRKPFWVFLGVTFSWFGWIFIGLSFIWFSSFGYVPTYIAGILMGLILFIKFWREVRKMCPLVYRNRRVFKSSWISLKPLLKHTKLISIVSSQHKCLIPFQIVFILILSILVPIFTQSSCLCFYNESWGWPLFGGNWNYNTRVIRQWNVGRVCPKDEICHVYVTIPEDGLSSAFLNIQTGIDVPKITVNYAKSEEYEKTKTFTSEAQLQAFNIEGLDNLANRNLFTAYLKDLTPDTHYTVKINYQAKSVEQTYKTPPDGDEKPLVIAIGGDVGNTKIADEITKMAVDKFKPDVFFINGNLAYDNNIRGCSFAYDKFLWRFEDAYKQLGYMVPLVLAVGDHDIGLNPQSGKKIPLDENGPLHSIYFPQHLSSDPDNKVPTLKERRSYHYHSLGDCLFTVLDTGYLTLIEQQKTWLNKNLPEFPSSAKFTIYHNPIFTPGLQDYSTQFLSTSMWVPIFDHFQFMAAFESRKNLVKKTFQLRNGVKSEPGTYYLGEGAWGVSLSDYELFNKTQIFEEAKRENHIWIMTFNKKENKVEYAAYSSSGDPLISKFEQDINNYLP